MYKEKIEPMLEDIEDKNIDVAGGAVVGEILAIISSLAIYICNLTIGKKDYQDVESEVIVLKNKAVEYKIEAINVIDKDREILENLLNCYKTRKTNNIEYKEACKSSAEFCFKVARLAINIGEIVDELEKIGNKMLLSDIKICKNYVSSSIKSSMINVNVNMKMVNDKNFDDEMKEKYKDVYIKFERLC